jgi:hypothetical protein
MLRRLLSHCHNRVVRIDGLGNVHQPVIGRNEDNASVAQDADFELAWLAFVSFILHLTTFRFNDSAMSIAALHSSTGKCVDGEFRPSAGGTYSPRTLTLASGISFAIQLRIGSRQHCR